MTAPVDPGAMAPVPRAFEREGLLGRVAPFVAAAAAAITFAIVDLASADQWWLMAGASVSAAALAFALLARWSRWPHRADIAPPLLYMVGVACLREATGGTASGYSPLFLIAILWFALYGTRRQLLVGIVVLAALMAIPIIAVGAPSYPLGEWRRLAILVLIAAALGVIVQRLVQDLRSQAAAARLRGRELEEQRDTTAAVLAGASDAVVSFGRDGIVASANPAAHQLLGRDDLIGLDVFGDLIVEGDRERVRAGFERVVAAGRAVDRDARFEAGLRLPDGTTLPVDISVAPTSGRGGIRIHTFVRDTSRQRAAERDAADHLHDLTRLLELAQKLGGQADSSRDDICAAARDLSHADFVLFFMPDPDGRRIVVAGTSGDPTVPTDVVLDPERSAVATVMREVSPLFVGDLTVDERADQAVVARVGARAAYWQPVVIDGSCVGVLVAYWRRRLSAMPERSSVILGLFATQAGTVLERAEFLARLESLARTDALTGLANRRVLDETLPKVIADAQRSDRPLSVAMLDLDHFKRFNDQHGHQAGDDLLREAATAWSRELRPGDTLVRYGGEEFLVVLPACDPGGALQVADRLRAVTPQAITASAGIATWLDGESDDAFVARADAALYRAKRAGRDRTVVADSGPA